MESSSSSSEPEDTRLCPWLGEEDLSLIRDVGLPDPYHWGNLQEWTEKVLQKYHGRISDSQVVRQRFIRTKCVRCRRLCEDADLEAIIDPPVALPCGHIMGWTCYAEFVDSYVAGDGRCQCPWNGPSSEEPPDWSPACGERAAYDCKHAAVFARIPSPSREFYLPREFFLPPDGFMPRRCRRCTVQDLLVQWTRDARRGGAGPNVFVSCAGIDGLTDEERTRLGGPHLQPEYQRIAAEKSDALSEMYAKTPAPIENGEPEVMSSVVCYLSIPEAPDRGT